MAENKITINVKPLGEEDPHSMDALAYAEIIKGVCHAVEAGAQVYGISRKPRLLVNAANRQGSIEWDIVWRVFEATQNFALTAQAINDAMAALDMSFRYIKSRTYALTGQSNQIVLVDENGKLIGEGEHISPNQAKILSKRKFNDGVSEIVGIENHGNIGSINITVVNEGQRERELRIAGEDIGESKDTMTGRYRLATYEADSHLESDVPAYIRKIDFDNGLWRFTERHGGREFFGEIEDDEFWALVHSGAASFSEGLAVVVSRKFIKGRTYKIVKIDIEAGLFGDM